MEIAQLVANCATALTLALGLWIFWWQAKTKQKEDRYRHSSFALEYALKAYDDSSKLLLEGNNDRVTWITSARILARANKIAQKITDEVHVNVLEIHRERYRRIFGNLLGFDDYKKGGSFFYGASDLRSSIDEAARESTKSKEISGEPFASGSIPALLAIPESVLWALWKFAKYPTEYDDPIGEEFPEDELNNRANRVLWPGLFEYLEHKEKYRLIGGSLVELKKGQIDEDLHRINNGCSD